MSVRGGLVQVNGRQVAYDEYGDPAGRPVIFCHGWPSSRSMARITADAALALRLRIISPDRPGISGSALQEDRTLLDWPAVVQALADELGLENFYMLGVSGGAPYAYVAAWAMPDRVSAVAVASGAPPIAELPDHRGLLQLYRWMLALHARQPQVVRGLFQLARPFASMRPPMRLRPLLLRLLQPCDAEVLRDTVAFEACFESSRQAWRTSAAGVMADAEIYALPWGFPLAEVRTPVHLWHGIKDRTFASHLAEELAARLPNCRLRLVEGAGHYSLPIRHMREILRDLAGA
ncbi:MAG: alpha/beta hydrolase [Verrucomicrobiota bacterium]|nr:alpha/beta hydrolase [Verrucomicrobiota bacterium]